MAGTTELSVSGVPVTSAAPLPVLLNASAAVDIGDVTLLAGTAVVGQVGIDQTTPGTTNRVVSASATVAVTVSVTLTVGATYATGDFVGTSGSPISFASAVRTSGGSATLRSITISDPAASAAVALELWLFNATITPPADSAAWDLSDAAGLTCVGIVSIPTTAQYLSSATGVMHVGNLGLQFHCAATTLFGALVTRGAPTYTGTLQVKLEIEYDQ